MNKNKGQGSPVLHTKVHGNRSTGPKEDFKTFYHIWARKPSGHMTNIILTFVFNSLYLKAYIQNFVKKGQVVSEKNKF